MENRRRIVLGTAAGFGRLDLCAGNTGSGSGGSRRSGRLLNGIRGIDARIIRAELFVGPDYSDAHPHHQQYSNKPDSATRSSIRLFSLVV
jgi:hypothetical protein